MGLRLDNESATRAMIKNGQATPLELYPGAHRPWRCKCNRCGEEVNPRLSKVNSGQLACRKCAIKAFAETRLLSDKAARDAMVERGVSPDPSVKYPGALKPWISTCLTCNRQISPTYANVMQGHNGCLYCTGKKVDLTEVEELFARNLLEPKVPYIGTEKPRLCKCLRCGREVSPSHNSLKKGQSGCAYCANRKVDPIDAEVLMRAAGLMPLIPYPGASKKWKCQCTACGRTVYPTRGAIQQGSGGCKYCAKNFVDAVEAESKMLTAKLQPKVPYPGSETPWPCTCLRCGKEVSPRYKTVNRGGGGCKFCAGIARLEPAQAEEVMRAAGLEPLEPYPGSHRPWKSKCQECGKEVSPSHKKVQAGGGCKFCSPSGIVYDAPGLIYLLQHEDFFALKIGITTTATRVNRINQHKEHGWVLIRQWSVLTGEQAEFVETDLIVWWRDVLGAPIALTKQNMPQGGFTETSSLLHVDIGETCEYIENLITKL